MKKVNYVLFLICVIGIIFSFLLFSKEGYLLKVNAKNRDLVENLLKGEVENTKDITKIILGQGWNSGKLTIYHISSKAENLYITEGKFDLGSLGDYIKENGYNLDKIGVLFLGISLLIIFYLIVYRYTKNHFAKRY